MEPDINNITLNEYLVYERHMDIKRSYTSGKSVAPMRNRILVYLDSDEDDEEYCSLPPLLPCFQTPQPCATFNLVPTHGFTSQFFNQSQYTPNPHLDEKDSSLKEILDDLFRIGTENLRKAEHEVPYKYDDKTMDITDYEDSDQEDGELLDLPTFSATNVFASICEQVKEDIGSHYKGMEFEVPTTRFIWSHILMETLKFREIRLDSGPELVQRQQIKIKVGDRSMVEVSSWKEVGAILEYRNKLEGRQNSSFMVEEPVEIIDRKVKSLKRSRILIVKSIGTRSEVMRIS
ncbi:hypothetical protein Tco_0311723 [Tanacetum coccineum]